jgi:hypothetical protein
MTILLSHDLNSGEDEGFPSIFILLPFLEFVICMLVSVNNL